VITMSRWTDWFAKQVKQATDQEPEGNQVKFINAKGPGGWPADGSSGPVLGYTAPDHLPPGLEFYVDANGKPLMKWNRDTGGVRRTSIDDMIVGPYSPNSQMHSFSAVLASAGDGSITAATLVGASANVRHILVDVSVMGFVTATPGTPAGGKITLSDMVANFRYLGVGGGGYGTYKGPAKQTTVNTVIQGSAAAGECSSSSTYIIVGAYIDG